ncbi:MAG: dihydroorotase family protein [Acidimicrobiales bacterium]
MPGLVDPHVHLREPGSNHSETIASGTKAALFGGYVLIGDMPNTPGHPTWTKDRLLEKHALARDGAHIPTTFHSGAQPESDNVGELHAMSRLSLWLKLYGAPTTGNANDYAAADFRDIVAEWHRVAPDKPIGLHAGRDNLEDFIAVVAGSLRHPLHIHHVSTNHELRLIHTAKRRDLPVTCGVTPHHLLKTAHDVRSEGWFARVQPPLVGEAEAEELMRCLSDGTIDIVETDHAPHSKESKLRAESDNVEGLHTADHVTCFGLPCIELAAPLLFYQARRGYITMERLVDALSTRPARIMGLSVSANTFASWEMREFRVGEENVHSQCSWTPYLGRLALGIPGEVLVQGKPLIKDGVLVDRAPNVVTNRGSEI